MRLATRRCVSAPSRPAKQSCPFAAFHNHSPAGTLPRLDSRYIRVDPVIDSFIEKEDGHVPVDSNDPGVDADRRGEPAVSTTSGRFVKRTPQQGRSTFRPLLPTIAEDRHETGPLASIGQHYAGLARDLRGSVNGAYRALQSVRSTPRKELAAKRAELEGHAAQLKRLIAETGMAEVDLGTVQALKQHEAPASNKPDSLRARAILVDRDIHEAGRQRNHARVALDRLERAIARLPHPTGR